MIQLAVALFALVADRLPTEDRERGATAVEYGLIVALIAAVVAGAVYALGGSIEGIFTDTNTCINNPGAANC